MLCSSFHISAPFLLPHKFHTSLPEHIMSTDMPDLTPGGLSQVEQGLHGLTSPNLRSLIDATHLPRFRSFSPREGNTQDDCRQEHLITLGAPLTGNRLLTMSWVVGLGITKAVYFYRGQSLISPTLDWVGGIIFTLM